MSQFPDEFVGFIGESVRNNFLVYSPKGMLEDGYIKSISYGKKNMYSHNQEKRIF